ETKMSEWIQRGVDQFSAMVGDAPKLGGGFGAVFQLQLCLASQVRRPEFRSLGMIERPHRLEQLQATRGPPAPERGRRGNHRKHHMRCEDRVRIASRQFPRQPPSARPGLTPPQRPCRRLHRPLPPPPPARAPRPAPPLPPLPPP